MFSLTHLVERPDTRGGRAFAFTIQGLIVVTLVTFSLETIPDLSADQRRALGAVEAFTVSVFTLEYLLRLWVARPRLRFVFSFYGLADLLAILPFYLAMGIDLRSLRAIRLMRLFRLLKLARYNRSVHRFQRALMIAKEDLVVFLFAAFLLLYFAAVGIYYFENAAQPEVFSSVFSSLWWAVITLTTVGYGDIYPVTLGGRVFTAVVLLVGLGVVAVPTGILSSALSQARAIEREEKKAREQAHQDEQSPPS